MYAARVLETLLRLTFFNIIIHMAPVWVLSTYLSFPLPQSFLLRATLCALWGQFLPVLFNCNRKIPFPLFPAFPPSVSRTFYILETGRFSPLFPEAGHVLRLTIDAVISTNKWCLLLSDAILETHATSDLEIIYPINNRTKVINYKKSSQNIVNNINSMELSPLLFEWSRCTARWFPFMVLLSIHGAEKYLRNAEKSMEIRRNRWTVSDAFSLSWNDCYRSRRLINRHVQRKLVIKTAFETVLSAFRWKSIMWFCNYLKCRAAHGVTNVLKKFM